jgi:single-strand DNA-binding protein
VVWGKPAEACKEYLHKGRLVHVEGSLRTRSYDDSTGHKRGVVEVVARRVQFLGANGQEREAAASLSGEIAGAPEPGDDEISF